MLALLAETNLYSNPLVIIVAIIWAVFVLYCAYLTAKNGRWLFFILGFFCGGIFWIIGAVLGPNR